MKKNIKILLAIAACSAPYFGLLQPSIAHAMAFDAPAVTPTLAPAFAFAPQSLSTVQNIARYGAAPSAWNNVFLNVETVPATFANYRPPKFQFNTAKSSLGLRLGYRLNSNFSVSSYYGKTNFGQPDAPTFSSGTDAFNPFTAKFSNTRFHSSHAGVDFAAHLNLLKRLTLFGRAGIASYTVSEHGSAKFARFGLGLHYDLNTRLGLRLEMERLRPMGAFNSAFGVENGLDNYSMGAVFKF